MGLTDMVTMDTMVLDTAMATETMRSIAPCIIPTAVVTPVTRLDMAMAETGTAVGD
jgi:hypothetical protein